MINRRSYRDEKLNLLCIYTRRKKFSPIIKHFFVFVQFFSKDFFLHKSNLVKNENFRKTIFSQIHTFMQIAFTELKSHSLTLGEKKKKEKRKGEGEGGGYSNSFFDDEKSEEKSNKKSKLSENSINIRRVKKKVFVTSFFASSSACAKSTDAESAE